MLYNQSNFGIIVSIRSNNLDLAELSDCFYVESVVLVLIFIPKKRVIQCWIPAL